MHMPRQEGGGDLFSKLGGELLRAHDEHKGDETDFSGTGQVPPNMKGIAQLKGVKFELIPAGKENAGNFRFHAFGIIQSPVMATTYDLANQVTGQTKVQGLRTSLFETLCNTPKA